MHAHDAVDPAGRRIERRHPHDRLGELAWMRLETAVLLGLQHADGAGLLHALDGRVGDLADSFGLDTFDEDVVGRGSMPARTS